MLASERESPVLRNYASNPAKIGLLVFGEWGDSIELCYLFYCSCTEMGEQLLRFASLETRADLLLNNHAEN